MSELIKNPLSGKKKSEGFMPSGISLPKAADSGDFMKGGTGYHISDPLAGTAESPQPTVNSWSDTVMRGVRNTENFMRADALHAGAIGGREFAEGLAENERINNAQIQSPDKLEAIKAIEESEGFVDTTLELGKQVITNPAGVGRFAAEQVGNFLPILGSAAVGGLAASAVPVPIISNVVGALAGTVVGTMAVETGAELVSALQKSGVDVTNPDAVTAAIDDEEFMSTALQRGLIRGGTIAAVDLATMGASRWLMGAPARLLSDDLARLGLDVSNKTKLTEAMSSGVDGAAEAVEKYNKSKTLKQKVKSGAAPFALELAGEPAGEAMAQLAVGDELDGTEIALEALGGVGTSLATTGISGAYDGVGKVKDNIKQRKKSDVETASDEVVSDIEDTADNAVDDGDTLPAEDDAETTDEADLPTTGFTDTNIANAWSKVEPNLTPEMEAEFKSAFPEWHLRNVEKPRIEEENEQQAKTEAAKKDTLKKEVSESASEPKLGADDTEQSAGANKFPEPRDSILGADTRGSKENTESVSEQSTPDASAKIPEVAGGNQQEAVEDSKQVFTPTHELPDGTKVIAVEDESNVWADEKGDEYEDNYASPISEKQGIAKEEEPESSGNKAGQSAGEVKVDDNAEAVDTSDAQPIPTAIDQAPDKTAGSFEERMIKNAGETSAKYGDKSLAPLLTEYVRKWLDKGRALTKKEKTSLLNKHNIPDSKLLDTFDTNNGFGSEHLKDSAGKEYLAAKNAMTKNQELNGVPLTLEEAGQTETTVSGLDGKSVDEGRVYNDAVEFFANELTEGGGISYLTDEHGNIDGKTPSVNPQWFINGGFLVKNVKGDDHLAKPPGVKEVKKAVADYKSGTKITKKQHRILEALDDLYKHDRQSELDDSGSAAQDALADQSIDSLIEEGIITEDMLLTMSQSEVNQAVEEDYEQAKQEQGNEEVPSPAKESKAGSDRKEAGGTKEESLLTSYTEEDITERDKAAADAKNAIVEADKKAAIDKESEQGLSLTGSDRVADSNPNQSDVFGSSAQNESSNKRSQLALRRSIDEMSDSDKDAAIAALRDKNEEMQRKLYTSHLTGLPNKIAYDDAPKKKYVASIDVDSLKWFNDNLGGHAAGDALLKATAEALSQSGVEAYHLSGDEFAAQSDNIDSLNKALADALDYLGQIELEFTLPDGAIVTANKTGFSHAIGENYEQADSGLQDAKAAREQAGLRTERGREPRGISRQTPRSDAVNESDNKREKLLPENVDKKEASPEKENVYLEKPNEGISLKELYLDGEKETKIVSYKGNEIEVMLTAHEKLQAMNDRIDAVENIKACLL